MTAPAHTHPEGPVGGSLGARCGKSIGRWFLGMDPGCARLTGCFWSVGLTGGNTGVGGFAEDGEVVFGAVVVDVGGEVLGGVDEDGGGDEVDVDVVLLEDGGALLEEDVVVCSASQVCSWVPYPALSKKLS